MKKLVIVIMLMLMLILENSALQAEAKDYLNQSKGQTVSGTSTQAALWWCSSGWKVGRDKLPPGQSGTAVKISAARNEAEAAQLVIRPKLSLSNFAIQGSDLSGPGGKVIAAENIEILRVQYVNVTMPTDGSSVAGYWPDPLVRFEAGERINLPANQNQPLWVRVKVPGGAAAGTYHGKLKLTASGYQAEVPLEVVVYDFDLPEKMTCTTAFGFSANDVYRYHNLERVEDRRTVLDKYLANFSAHHISPYNPAPMDSIGVKWPTIKPPPEPFANWGENARIVTNESHSGKGSLLIFDDDREKSVTVSYQKLIEIPPQGLRFRFWFRTAIPGQLFGLALNHYDKDGKWISGKNYDMSFEGNGKWQEFDETVIEFPAEARFVRIMARGAVWTETGEHVGLVWYDDISVSNPETNQEYIEHGDFEAVERTEPLLPAEELAPKLDFARWDQAMARAIDYYHFNSFRLGIPGMGGGTFHSRNEPTLLGFSEDMPEYKIMFDSYCHQMQEHLRKKGWLDEAFIYWFDEPSPKDYAFVSNGFAKLKQSCPDIRRMLTEQPEPGLFGGPEIWCVISNLYNEKTASQRREIGEKFWWYVCTGPKAPYCTLFIDHPGTELRVWLWQSWQRQISGILIWQSNYWTSGVAYPDADQPQNPYEDPMGWVSGYGTPKGTKRPWGNGDGRFIYPPPAAADGRAKSPVLDGPMDSIRWEMLRDGIEDYEYLAILKRLLSDKKTDLTETQQNKFTALLKVPSEITSNLTTFTTDPAPIETRRDQIAQAIEQLSRK
ncbi:MAG: DUF4091 domain-containing protein [Sedimentisphaerales bacterium]|nr:DUF4091 domain-containing protein [Sedimentisphaerales bacterium]